MTSLRLLALQRLDPRIAAAQALERHADEVSAMLDDLTERERALRWEAQQLREAVEMEKEAAEMQVMADRELLPMRRRRG